ncbi:unnamed protein product, partial [Citrullus colocynthis]
MNLPIDILDWPLLCIALCITSMSNFKEFIIIHHDQTVSSNELQDEAIVGLSTKHQMKLDSLSFALVIPFSFVSTELPNEAVESPNARELESSNRRIFNYDTWKEGEQLGCFTEGEQLILK